MFKLMCSLGGGVACKPKCWQATAIREILHNGKVRSRQAREDGIQGYLKLYVVAKASARTLARHWKEARNKQPELMQWVDDDDPTALQPYKEMRHEPK